MSQIIVQLNICVHAEMNLQIHHMEKCIICFRCRPLGPFYCIYLCVINNVVNKFPFNMCFPGCAVLKLSDGRKRSMSLWVEFITASGYLSARKIRCRFQTLVAQACDKSSYRDSVKMMNDASEVKIRIREKYVVQITPAFKCNGVWPRSAAQWPSMTMTWPHPNMAAQV